MKFGMQANHNEKQLGLVGGWEVKIFFNTEQLFHFFKLFTYAWQTEQPAYLQKLPQQRAWVPECRLKPRQ